MHLAKGTLLLSEPFLHDSNFERAVILICEHNEKGAFGFVVNKSTHFTINEVADDVESQEHPLFVGGPVEQNTLHYIHTIGPELEGAVDLGHGFYWGGDYEQLKSLLNQQRVSQEEIRFFLGYSGWSEGQLEEELDQHTWVINDQFLPRLFDVPADGLWREAMKDMGGQYKLMANFPLDPRLN